MSSLGRWDPRRGKWKLNKIIKEYIQVTPDPVTVDALIWYLKTRGYHPTETRRILSQFVEIDEKGCVSMKKRGD
ncbi:unnamed protein product [marine sediment metagenome]|uniref:Uncharacterized protein n=1 Tax=marine sediment metagenome TaxID=412755 RepID=X1HRZ9_9ZZZZ